VIGVEPLAAVASALAAHAATAVDSNASASDRSAAVRHTYCMPNSPILERCCSHTAQGGCAEHGVGLHGSGGA
jgi:hypothetical protein